MKKPIWDLWTGKRIKSPHTGEIFIATTDDQWFTRFTTWKRSLAGGPNEISKTDCPCPLPDGHVNFDSYEDVTPDKFEKQMQLF